MESAFRQLKTVDRKIRPIHPFTRRRIETHFFIGMRAEYVRGPRKARRAPLLLAEEDPDGVMRDRVVAPAERSVATRQKVATKTTPYGTRAMSFPSLMPHWSTLTKAHLEETSGRTRQVGLGALTPTQSRPSNGLASTTDRPPPAVQISLNFRVKFTTDRPMPTLKYYKLEVRHGGASATIVNRTGPPLAPIRLSSPLSAPEPPVLHPLVESNRRQRPQTHYFW